MDAYAWTQTTDHTGVRGDTPDKPLVPSRPSAAWPECDAHGARGSCKCSHARAQRVYGSAGAALSVSALSSPRCRSRNRARVSTGRTVQTGHGLRHRRSSPAEEHGETHGPSTRTGYERRTRSGARSVVERRVHSGSSACLRNGCVWRAGGVLRVQPP